MQTHNVIVVAFTIGNPLIGKYSLINVIITFRNHISMWEGGSIIIEYEVCNFLYAKSSKKYIMLKIYIVKISFS